MKKDLSQSPRKVYEPPVVNILEAHMESSILTSSSDDVETGDTDLPYQDDSNINIWKYFLK